MKKTITIIALLISTVVCIAQESTILKHNYKNNDAYIVNLSLKQNMGLAGSSSLMMKTKVDVDKVTKTGFMLISKVKRIDTRSVQGSSEKVFNTDMKEASLDAEGKKLKAQLSPIVAATSYINFNKRGKILSKRVTPDLKGANEGMAIYCEFPKEAVKVGSSWTNEQEVQGIKLKIIYTVKKITSSSVETIISGDVDFMGIVGNLKGTAIFNKENGNTNEMNINTSINMQGMEVGMSLKTTSKKM